MDVTTGMSVGYTLNLESGIELVKEAIFKNIPTKTLLT